MVVTDHRPSRRAAWLATALVASVVLPVLVAGAAVLGDDYTPIGDEAVTLLRVADVGTSATPLVGAYSTRGWSHPGPVLFWALALPDAVGGDHHATVLAATAVLNTVAGIGIGALAWRRGRLPLVALTMVGLAWLLHGIGPGDLVWPWNPLVALLPYALFLLATWSLACRDWVALPVAVAVGSALVQLHVAYAALVGVALVVAALLALRPWERRRTDGPVEPTADAARPTRRQVTVTAALALVLWLPVAWDLAFGSHNLLRVARYFLDPGQPPIGASRGVRILSGHLAPTGPWSGGEQVVAFGNVAPGSPVWLPLVAAAVVAVAVACARRGRRDGTVLMAVVGTQLVVGTYAVTRIEEPVLPYLVAWTQPLAMVAWVALAWGTLVALRPAGTALDGGRTATGAVAAAAAAAAAVAVVVAVVVPVAATGPAWADPALPRAHAVEPVEAVMGELRSTLPPDARLRVEIVGDHLGESSAGVIAALIHDGHDVVTSDGAGPTKWGRERRWQGQPVDTTLTVAVALHDGEPEPLAACEQDQGVRAVARHSGLTAGEEERLQRLRVRRMAEQEAMDPAAQRRLDDLQRRHIEIAVFEGPRVCGATTSGEGGI